MKLVKGFMVVGDEGERFGGGGGLLEGFGEWVLRFVVGEGGFLGMSG